MAAPGSPDGLELLIAARGSDAVLTLRNGGTGTLTVFSHVDAGELHYDWFTITLESGEETRVLRLQDNRNESARVTAELAPGEQLEHVVDVVAWARRAVNGARPLAAGTYRMWATYEVAEPSAPWRGALRSPITEITIPRTRRGLATLLRGRDYQ